MKLKSKEQNLRKAEPLSMVERLTGSDVVELEDYQTDAEEDGLFRPWKRTPTNQRPSPELILISKTGDRRSLTYSDQKGTWHGGDVIVVKYIEEHVFYLIIRGQNITELANGLSKRRIEWIHVIDETRSQVIDRAPDCVDQNVFEISIVKRRWGEECEWDAHFDSF